MVSAVFLCMLCVLWSVFECGEWFMFEIYALCIFFETEFGSRYPGWSAMVHSRLIATSAS